MAYLGVRINKKKILFVSNVPSPYTIEYLNELGKYADVTGVFERATSSERDASWSNLNVKNFTCIILKGIKCAADSAFSPTVLRYINRFKGNYIIIGNPATPTGILSILCCKYHKIKFALQSEGGLAGSGKGLKETFKRFLMKDAILYLSGMNPSHDYFLTYGATRDRIVQYPFASMHQSDIRTSYIDVKEKVNAKRELRIPKGTMVLYVGRFIKGKGVDSLIKACGGISDVNLYLVGGSPTEEYQTLSNNYRVKTHYVKHCDFQSLKKYYMAADIFVLPTHSDTWGLVINEAMSFGLPIITTNKCVAGLELIKDDENGYIVPVNDVKKLKLFIERLSNDPIKRKEIANRNLDKIQLYSYEKMAEIIYSALISADWH